MFSDRGRRLGYALGVPDHVSHVFAEAEVRACVAFPLSSILTILARACEASYGGDGALQLVRGGGDEPSPPPCPPSCSCELSPEKQPTQGNQAG